MHGQQNIKSVTELKVLGSDSDSPRLRSQRNLGTR